MIDIGIVNAHLGAHLGEFADDHLRAAITGVADVLAVARAADQHVGSGDVAAHVRKASRVSSATCRPRVSLMSMAVGVILKTSSPSSKPRMCL